MREMLAVSRRELLHFVRALGRAGMIRLVLVFFVVFAVFVPLRSDSNGSDLILLIFAVLPLYLAGPGAVDAFAGEKERETLETLLTSPLSAAQMMWGKLVAVIAYALAFTWAPMLLYCVINLIRHGRAPAAEAILMVSVLGLLVAFLSSALGISLSAKARSVRAAQHWFALILLALFIGLPMLATQAHGFVPQWVLTALTGLFRGGWLSTGMLLTLLSLLLIAVPCGFYMYARTARLWRMNDW
ncbi:ABC transporter permease [Candidatus Fermentibacterales bacterium]|nr:ABC transporter permease [Candidatus Fermentibacterales bacterium]